MGAAVKVQSSCADGDYSSFHLLFLHCSSVHVCTCVQASYMANNDGIPTVSSVEQV